MATPPEDTTYIPSVVQATVNSQVETEPLCRKRIVDALNRQCAEARKMVVLRQMQPSPGGHVMQIEYNWSEEEADRYLTGADPLALPVDHTTLPQNSKCVSMWIFDAIGTGGDLSLLELELDAVPDFGKYPAICIFDVDGAGQVLLIPSVKLEMHTVGPNRIKFALKDDRGIAQGAAGSARVASCKPPGNWSGPA